MFWVDASSRASAERGFIDIGNTCDIPQPSLKSVKNWLAATKNTWLLILDNADDTSIDYAEYFPSGNRGCIILTTRNSECHIHSNVGSQKMVILDQSDAVALLLKATGVKQDSWCIHESAAEEVAAVLGSHTLALVQAGAFIQKGLCSIEEYPNLFHQQRRRLLEFHPVQAKSEYGGVYSTFEVSAQHLESSAHISAKIALALLGFLAFVHFDDVPLSSIIGRAWEFARAVSREDSQADDKGVLDLSMWHVSKLPALMGRLPDRERRPARRPHGSLFALLNKIKPKRRRAVRHCFGDEDLDTVLLNQACAHLASFSIVSINKTTRNLSMHPLAHAWARDRLTDSAMEEARVSTGCHLALSIEGQYYYDYSDDPFFFQLQSHINSHFQAWPLESIIIPFEVVQLLHCLAYQSNRAYSVPEAQRILQFLIMHEKVKATPDADLAISDMLASCYRQSNNLIEAQMLLENKVEVYKTVASESLLYLRIELGFIYQRMKKTDEARQLFEEILQQLEPNNEVVRLDMQHALGSLYINFGDVDKGIPLLKEVVRERDSTLEPENSYRLNSHISLAHAYLEGGDMDRGISILEEVVQIHRRTLRRDDWGGIVSEFYLGKAYVNVGEIQKGIELLEGLAHGHTAASNLWRTGSLNELTRAYLSTGRVDEAIERLTEIVRTERLKLKPEDEILKCSEELLAQALRQRDSSLGQTGEASGVKLLPATVQQQRQSRDPAVVEEIDQDGITENPQRQSTLLQG